MKSPRLISRIVPGLLATAGLLWFAQMTWAAPVHREQAAAAARGWLKAQTHFGEAAGKKVGKVEAVSGDAREVLYYAINLEPTGFILVSSDDLLEPVMAFAGQGSYVASPANPLCALVSADASARLQHAHRQAGAPAPASVKARGKWHDLQEADSGPGPIAETGYLSISDVRVSPLTQTTWSQSIAGDIYGAPACYNYYTPGYGDGDPRNYYAGCVATAMAQMMRYWQYPTTSVDASTPFTIYVNGTAATRYLRGGDGYGAPYSWANMPLSPSSSSTLVQRQAIGALVADCGTSVGMAYTASGSSAVSLNSKQAFINQFQYGNAVRGWNVNSEIGSALLPMVNPNLDARCPVILGISGAGGHAVVCDGYGYDAGTLYHHLNLGWSGSDTAWYNLPIIDTSLGTFTIVHSCVYNVFTNGTGEIISGRIVDDSGSPLANVTVVATRTGGGTYSATSDARGIYALAKLPANSQYNLSATKTGYGSAGGSYSTTVSTDNTTVSGNFWGANFTLVRGPLAIDHFEWNTVPSPQTTNAPFAVTILARNSTNGPASGFDGTVSLSGSGTIRVSQLMLGNVSSTSYMDPDYGWTDGYEFTPSVDIQVTHFRTYYGAKASIWSDTHERLATQNVSSAGYWTETALTAPITLQAGRAYRVSVYYSTYTTAYYNDYPPATFAHGTITPASYYADGDVFPSNLLDSSIPMIDLRYTVPGTGSVAVNPASVTLSGGTWSGNLTVGQSVSSLIVTANDGQGHTGASNPFDVGGPVAPAITSQPQNVTVGAGGTATFRVGASGTAPLSYFWRRNGNPIAGANTSTYSVTNAQLSDSGAQFTCLVSNAVNTVLSQPATLTVVPPPRLLSDQLKRYPDGQFEFVLSGSSGLSYEIQVSSDLSHWAPLKTQQLSAPTATVLDTNTSFSRRFYRAVMLP